MLEVPTRGLSGKNAVHRQLTSSCQVITCSGPGLLGVGGFRREREGRGWEWVFPGQWRRRESDETVVEQLGQSEETHLVGRDFIEAGLK